jgi:hypothetical protein
MDGLRQPPTTDRAKATLLLKAIFSDIAKDKLEAILAIRAALNSKERVANAGNFLSSNLEHGAGCIDEKDYTAMSKVVAEHRATLREAQERYQREREARASMVGVVMPPRDAGANVAIEWAKAWMPTVGALTKDEKLHMRWKCTYPNPMPPYWCSKAWGGKFALSQKQALAHVLGIAWEWHTAATGAACPPTISLLSHSWTVESPNALA